MRLKRFAIGYSIAILAVVLAPHSTVPSQIPTLTIGTATGNDTLYVGLPGAVVFSIDNPDTCITSINWWCEWQMTNGISLGHIGASSNPEWSPAALQTFDTLSAVFFADILSPETTLVTGHDLDQMPWVGSGELFRVHVTPRRTGVVNFNNQFTTGPPTWQTTVTHCGGSPFIPVVNAPPIPLVPCPMGNLVGGDVNFDREVAAVDIVYLVGTVYKASSLPIIPNLGDANCDFELDATDIIVLVNYVFRGGPPPCDPCLTVSQNDPPETYILFDTLEIIQPTFSSARVVRPRSYYSLPAPTTTYPGITIPWAGSDTLDYPATQPPFDFHWILYGPYTDQLSAVPDSSKILQTTDNPGTQQLEWTSDTSHTFYDLREGWYVFWIRARDDSLEADPTPAIVRFPVLEPTFHKPYLLMDATNWRNGALLNVGSYNFRDPRNDSLEIDTLRALYEDAFTGHGYAFNPANDIWYRQTDLCPDCYIPLPDRDVLGTYKALIVYDEDMNLSLDRDNAKSEYTRMLGEYLSVGGRVVLIGRNLFAPEAGWNWQDVPAEIEIGPETWSRQYFNISSMYFGGSTREAQGSPDPLVDQPKDVSSFASATSLDPDFPKLLVDTMRTLALSQLPIPGLLDRNGDGRENWLWVPDVNVLDIDSIRGGSAIYTFDAADSVSSPLHGRICGARFEYYDTLLATYTFRTAVMTFPFSTLQQDASPRATAGALLDYILSDSSSTAVQGTGTRPPWKRR